MSRSPWVNGLNVSGHSAEIVLKTWSDSFGVAPDSWYEVILDTYEEQMDWSGLPVKNVDVQGGGDEVLIEVIIDPYFPMTADAVAEAHSRTLHRIRENHL